MARGGTRTGTPGKSYGNRQDLNQAVKVATGEPYGVAQQLENAQRAIPLPNSAATPASPAAAPAPVDAGPPALPGQSPFDRPTERPQEPVTAGLPSGPGPEILASTPNPTQADAMKWARYLPSLEFMASQPDASMSTRQFVRRLRSMIPPEPPTATPA